MIANTRLSVLAALLPIVCLSACSPTINSVSVTPGSDVNKVDVQANIGSAPAASLGTPVVRVASLPGNPPAFHNVPGGFTENNPPNHSLSNLALPEGQFRVEVQQPYTPIFTSGTQIVSASKDVTIAPQQGCFFFDGGLQGWTTDGFFDLPTTGPRVTLCGGQPVQIAANGPNFPENYSSPIPAASFHSLATQLNPLINACFSNPTPTPTSGFVIVDLISPDLSSLPGWITANGFEVQTRGFVNVAGGPGQRPKAQLLLQQDATTFFRPEDAQQHPIFVDIQPGFAPASFVRPNTTLQRVRVRLFGPTGVGVTNEAEIDIDRVCPKTAS